MSKATKATPPGAKAGADIASERDEDDADTLGLHPDDGPRAGGALPGNAEASVACALTPSSLPTKPSEGARSSDAGKGADQRDPRPSSATNPHEGTHDTDAGSDGAAASALASAPSSSSAAVPTSSSNTPDWSLLPPGAYRVYGPEYNGEDDTTVGGDPHGDNEGTTAAGTTMVHHTDRTAEVADGGVVLEGFVPEPPTPAPTPEERQEERARREVARMMAAAVTLDASAVRTIPTHEEQDEKGGAAKWKRLHSPLCAILLTVGLLLAVALGVALGGQNAQDVTDDEAAAAVPSSCSIDDENVSERYEVARSIVAEISAEEALDDDLSPQAQALEWIVCTDATSIGLLDKRDPTSGALPAQTHGTAVGGDAGEAQLLRRYALATFFHATTADGPWIDPWNFLSNEHECAWHKNYTRSNFPYGDFDPAGVVCAKPDQYLVLDDAAGPIEWMQLNFRIANNMTGTLPPEFGHLVDINGIMMENQKGLRGSIPSTMGSMKALGSFSIHFFGPDFGGPIPSSLFTIPAMEYLDIQNNEGVWEFPPEVEGESPLLGLSIKNSFLSGPMPSYLSNFKKLTYLELKGNALTGSIPESFFLPVLDLLNLYDNRLNGTLPPSLGEMTNLTAMTLGANNFRGALPSSLGQLRKLKLLDLGGNKLEGPLPPSFSRLTALEHLSLQNNGGLNGTLAAFASLGNLSSLVLYGNDFSGTIPEGLFSVPTGRSIFADFGHNNLTGGLPTGLSRQASNTSYLAIMGNDFDADSVDDVICEEAQNLFADCSSCECCSFCCEDAADVNDPYCNYELNFYSVVGLDCGVWWQACRTWETYYDPTPQ